MTQPWTISDITPADGDLAGDERSTLQSFLRWHRDLFQHKCAGLTPEQLATASVPPSNLTLLGLIRHLAKVERKWFRERVAGLEMEPMYDPALGPDADFEQLDPATAREEFERWQSECRLADVAWADVPLDRVYDFGEPHGRMSLRTIVVHVIEEYAQHNGHADLIRERLDGVTDKD